MFYNSNLHGSTTVILLLSIISVIVISFLALCFKDNGRAKLRGVAEVSLQFMEVAVRRQLQIYRASEVLFCRKILQVLNIPYRNSTTVLVSMIIQFPVHFMSYIWNSRCDDLHNSMFQNIQILWKRGYMNTFVNVPSLEKVTGYQVRRSMGPLQQISIVCCSKWYIKEWIIAQADISTSQLTCWYINQSILVQADTSTSQLTTDTSTNQFLFKLIHQSIS